MTDDIKVTGAEELSALAARCKATGQNEIRKQMLRGLRESVKPTAAEIKASAVRMLPRRGGLGQLVAKSKIAARTRASASSAQVKLETKLAGHDLESIDRGRLRRPTFGHVPWVTQVVPAGFWSNVVEQTADETRERMQQVLDDTAEQLGG